MRRILIEQARRKQSLKAGGELERVIVTENALVDHGPGEDILSLDAALTKLEEHYPRKAELVKLRYFGGLTIEQAAECLGVAPSTAIADWAYAKGWLKLEITKSR